MYIDQVLKKIDSDPRQIEFITKMDTEKEIGVEIAYADGMEYFVQFASEEERSVFWDELIKTSFLPMRFYDTLLMPTYLRKLEIDRSDENDPVIMLTFTDHLRVIRSYQNNNDLKNDFWKLTRLLSAYQDDCANAFYPTIKQ